jgi:hypothetical protein
MKMWISISIHVEPDVNLPGGIALDGIHFRARRSGNGQSRDRRRGVRGYGLPFPRLGRGQPRLH